MSHKTKCNEYKSSKVREKNKERNLERDKKAKQDQIKKVIRRCEAKKNAVPVKLMRQYKQYGGVSKDALSLFTERLQIVKDLKAIQIKEKQKRKEERMAARQAKKERANGVKENV